IASRMCGDVLEQRFSIWTGSGGNGKSILIDIITNLIYNIVITQEYLTKYGLSRGQILIQNGIDLLLAIFNIVFIYHMCYICRGFVGFLVLLLINGSIGLIRAAVFSNYAKASFKMGIDNIKNKK
ncbi:hypothetical protein N8569_00875, partial [bacterium]|nr:hypothetical protein [bacterium]